MVSDFTSAKSSKSWKICKIKLFQIPDKANFYFLAVHVLDMEVKKNTVFQFQITLTTSFWFSMSVDWQMFVIAPVLIYLGLKIGRKFLVALLSILFLISSWIAFNIAMQNKFMTHKISLYV